MNKRSKILAGLTAGILAIGAMCFGFAQWSTDIALNGSVSAAGSWDVSVTDAAVELSSKGANFVDQEVTVNPTYDVVLYDVYVDYSNNYYHFRVDDVNARTVSMSAEDFAPYDRSNATWIGVFTFESGADRGNYTFLLNRAEGTDNMVEKWYNRTNLKAADGGAMDGQCIGTAIGWCYQGFATNTPANDKVILTHDLAKAFYAANPAGTQTVPAETTFTADSVTYAPVNFSLPGAWAQYSVTITNNGSANANLSHYQIDLENLGEPYQVDMPEFGEDEVLLPGESCTVNFVISVDADTSFNVESKAFSIRLTYVQDAVEEAPAAGHIHPAN